MGQFENFKSEQELVGRIEKLRADGVHDNDITVFSKEALEGTSLNYTGVNFKNADGSAWDKFVSLFTSAAPEERALADLDLNESEKEDYITSLQAGDILLHVNDVALGESDKMGSDEDEASRYDSDDNNVGGEQHDKQGVGEEENPGVANTAAAADTEGMGSTLSAGDELEDDDDTAPSTRAELDRNYEAREVDSISDLDEEEKAGARVTDVEPNLEYEPEGAVDSEDKDYEGTMRAEDRDLGDPEDKDFEGTMRPDADENNDSESTRNARVTEAEPNLEYEPEDTEDPEDKDYEGTMRAEDRDLGDSEDNIKQTAERVDVSSYGYDDTENRDHIETSSEDGNTIDDEDIKKQKADLDKQYYSKENDIHKNEPDRRNLNM